MEEKTFSRYHGGVKYRLPRSLCLPVVIIHAPTHQRIAPMADPSRETTPAPSIALQVRVILKRAGTRLHLECARWLRSVAEGRMAPIDAS